MAQADARATGDFNHGVWWAKTAVEMAALRNLQMGKVCVCVCVRVGACAGGEYLPCPAPLVLAGVRRGGVWSAGTHEQRHCQHTL